MRDISLLQLALGLPPPWTVIGATSTQRPIGWISS